MTNDATAVTPKRDRRELIKLVAGIIVILSFVALAALAIAASRSDFSLISAPAGAQEGEPLPAVPDLRAISTPLPARVPAPTPPSATAEVVAPAADLSAEPELPPPSAPAPSAKGKPCAQLSLPAPDKVGGIQSLVRLIPLFGPFSPEAFAMLPAFQPGMDALGPLFPLFESGLDQLAPVLDLTTPVVQQLGEAGFGTLAPLYGPYREDVLAGETALAAFLQPIVQSLATAPGSECLIALEGVLASLPSGAQ